MLKENISRLILFIIMLFLSKPLLLRGGERQGFIYGLTLGYGFTRYPERIQYWSPPESSENITKGGISMIGKIRILSSKAGNG